MAKIVVEGIEDVNFIKSLAKHRLTAKQLADQDFINSEGCDKLHLIEGEIEKEIKSGGKVLIIFDSDQKSKSIKDNKVDGYTSSLENIQKWKDEFLIKLLDDIPNVDSRIKIFILPNNASEGNLETLLRQIVIPEYATFLNQCIDSYANCVNSLQLGNYQVNEKQKFYIYSTSLTKSSGKGRDRDYAEIFNLHSPALDPLVIFLTKHLSS